jgi:hypothetical protein
VSELLAMTSTTKERKAGHWITVHSDYWRRVLGWRYAQTIRTAVHRGLVEVNDCYSTGRFAKSYRLPAGLRVPDVQEYPLKRTTAPQTRLRIADGDSVGQKLVSHFEAVSVPNVDCSGWASYSVKACMMRNHYAIRCEHGRLHTTFTALPKSIRSTLTITSEPTLELDVANCQPLILGVQAVSSTHTPPHPHPHYHMSHNSTNLGGYLELCQSGQLYEFLLERCRQWRLRDWVPSRFRDRVTDRPLTRGDVKKAFIVMMFAPVPLTTRLPMFSVVSQEWPSLAAYIIEAKRSGHEKIATDCQRFESALMIDTIAGSLAWPCVTVHDSLIVPAHRASDTAHAIRSAWRQYGVSVSVKATGRTEGHDNTRN